MKFKDEKKIILKDLEVLKKSNNNSWKLNSDIKFIKIIDEINKNKYIVTTYSSYKESKFLCGSINYLHIKCDDIIRLSLLEFLIDIQKKLKITIDIKEKDENLSNTNNKTFIKKLKISNYFNSPMYSSNTIIISLNDDNEDKINEFWDEMIKISCLNIKCPNIDINFIQFYVNSIYNKSIEEYFHVERSTVSNWRKRGMPKRYLITFIDMEKSDNIYELFERIYPKT